MRPGVFFFITGRWLDTRLSFLSLCSKAGLRRSRKNFPENSNTFNTVLIRYPAHFLTCIVMFFSIFSMIQRSKWRLLTLLPEECLGFFSCWSSAFLAKGTFITFWLNFLSAPDLFFLKLQNVLIFTLWKWRRVGKTVTPVKVFLCCFCGESKEN